MKKNNKIDWTIRENKQAKKRIADRGILRIHRYPPAMEIGAIETVIEQVRIMVYRLAEIPEKKPCSIWGRFEYSR